MRHTAALVRVLLGLTVLGLAAPALAQPLDDTDVRIARRHFTEGSALYEKGRYKEALVEFQAALRVMRHPAFHYNIAKCYDNLERYEEAIVSYERYLESGPKMSDVPAVRKRIATLRARRLADDEERARRLGRGEPPLPAPGVGHGSTPEQDGLLAMSDLDGAGGTQRATARTATTATADRPAGPLTASIDRSIPPSTSGPRPGVEPQAPLPPGTNPTTPPPGASTPVTTPPGTSTPVTTTPVTDRPLRWTWASAGVGVASLVAGAALVLVAHARYDAAIVGPEMCSPACPQDRVDEIARYETSGFVLLGAAGVFAVGAVALWWLERHAAREPAPTPAPAATSPTATAAARSRATLTPRLGIGPGGALQLRF